MADDSLSSNPPVLVTATPEGARRLAERSQGVLKKLKKNTWMAGGLLLPFGVKIVVSAVVIKKVYDLLKPVAAEGSDDLPALAEALQELLGLGHRVEIMDPEEAHKRFKFYQGHVPADGAIYVAHPVLRDAYILPETFGPTLAAEKTAVFRRLVAALGAQSMSLVSATTEESKGFLKGSGKLQKAASQASVRARFDKKGELLKDETARFGRPSLPPHVPEDIAAWVAWDADLRTLVQQRTDQNLLYTKITVSYSDFSSRHGGASLALMGASNTGSLTAGYDKLIESSWMYEINFWDKDLASADQSEAVS